MITGMPERVPVYFTSEELTENELISACDTVGSFTGILRGHPTLRKYFSEITQSPSSPFNIVFFSDQNMRHGDWTLIGPDGIVKSRIEHDV